MTLPPADNTPQIAAAEAALTDADKHALGLAYDKLVARDPDWGKNLSEQAARYLVLVMRRRLELLATSEGNGVKNKPAADS